jgi:hypothetical protein
MSRYEQGYPIMYELTIGSMIIFPIQSDFVNIFTFDIYFRSILKFESNDISSLENAKMTLRKLKRIAWILIISVRTDLKFIWIFQNML